MTLRSATHGLACLLIAGFPVSGALAGGGPTAASGPSGPPGAVASPLPRRLRGGFLGHAAPGGEAPPDSTAPAGRPLVIDNRLVSESAPPSAGAKGRTGRRRARRKEASGREGPKGPAPSTAAPAAPATYEPRDLHGHDEQYWRGRARSLHEAVALARKTLKEAKSREAKLEQEFYSWDDGQYRDRVISPELAQAREDVEEAGRGLAEATKALDELGDEARRAGAMPGWIRQ